MKEAWRAGLSRNGIPLAATAAVLILPALLVGAPQRRLEQFTFYGLLGGGLLLFWLCRAAGWPPVWARATLFRGPHPAMLLYAGWSLVASCLSIDPFYSRLALLQLGFGALLYAIVASEFRRPGPLRLLLAALLALAGGLVLQAFVFDGDRRWVGLGGAFHDRQLFGAFLALLLPVLLAAAAGIEARFARMLARLILLLAAGGLLLTQCRSAWLGAGTALLVFGILAARHAPPRARLRARDAALAGALAVAILGILIGTSGTGSALLQRAATFGTLGQDPSITDRVRLWEDAAKVISQRPLTGWGIGTYAFAQARLGLGARSEQLIRELGPSLGESPHNTYLQIAAEQGIPGLLLYLLILAAFFRCGLRALPRLEPGLGRLTLIGCLAAMAGQCVDAVSNPAWMYPEVTTFFWLVLGTGMAAGGIQGLAVKPFPATPVGSMAPVGPAPPSPPAPAPRLRPEAVPGSFFLRATHSALIGWTMLWIGGRLLHLVGAAVGGGDGLDRPAAIGAGRVRASRPAYSATIERLELHYLNDAGGALPTFHGTVQAGTAARFRVYAVADDGQSRAEVTGEGPERLSVRLAGSFAGPEAVALLGQAQVTHPLVMAPPHQGRQLHVLFRRMPEIPVEGTLEVVYRYGRTADQEVAARFRLRVLPHDPGVPTGDAR